MLPGIKQLKAETEQKMAADIGEIKELLELALLAKVRPSPPSDSPKRDFTWAPGPQTPVLPSLKRKRDDIDENGEEDGHQHGNGQGQGHSELADGPAVAVDVDTVAGGVAPLAPGCADGMALVDDYTCVYRVEAASTSVSDSESPRPRKRARRIASALAQSATALTIGAVVTWSALAFS